MSASAAKSARFFRECRSCGFFWIGIQIAEHHFFCSTHISFPDCPVFTSIPDQNTPVYQYRREGLHYRLRFASRAAGQFCAIVVLGRPKVMTTFDFNKCICEFLGCQG